MAKFPTQVERAVTVRAPSAAVYRFLWDVPGAAACIPGVKQCVRAGKNTYRFIYAERWYGPVSMTPRYTLRYSGNGMDEIRFESIRARHDNTDVSGVFRLRSLDGEATRLTLQQVIAADTPVPRLLQSLIKSFVVSETEESVRLQLANIKRALEQVD